MALPRDAICTITTTAYERQAACMLDSYLRHHPGGRAFILHVDEESVPPLGARPEIVRFLPHDLGISGFAAMRARYSRFELCNALKPFLLDHIFRTTDVDRVCYCDGDLFFFGSLVQGVWDELESASLLLTPHLVHVPADDPDLIWRDLAVLQHGSYNGGFIGLRRSADSERFLRWWGDRTRRLGQKKLEDGLNCDQRWLDLVPGFDVNCRISRHPGLNAAYWNLHERTFTRAGDQFLVNGYPLLFFHFSGYSPDRPDLVTRHPTHFNFNVRQDLVPIFEVYQAALHVPVARTEPERAARTASAEPAVSVVIAAHDASRYLAQCLESVLAQTLEDVDIIVIDDGSTDETVAVAESFARAHSGRVKVERQAHAGVSAARNRGIEIASGRYVAFLDADDWYVSKTKLADQAAILDQRPDVGIVHSGWRLANADGELLNEQRPWMRVPVLDLEGWLLWQVALPSAMMLRREALNTVGGFDVSLRHLEDVDLAWRVALGGYATVWLEQVTTAYRQHRDNSTRRVADAEADTRSLLDRFFARPDLTPAIRALANRARTGAFKWLALQYYRAASWSDAIRLIEAAVPLETGLSSGEKILRILDDLEHALRDEFGEPFDAHALTSRPEWHELVRTHIVGLPFEQAVREISRQPSIVGTPTRSASNPNAYRTVAPTVDLSDVLPPLDLSAALAGDYGRHRSGWAYAVRSLMPLHRDAGVLVDAFVEHTFGNTAPAAIKPYDRSWIGFLHNPPNMPDWFVFNQSPQELIANVAFRASLAHCLGMFCLSDYLAEWWRARLNQPVGVVRLPADRPAIAFSIDRFADNPGKRLVQIGSWLRRLHSIYYVPVRQLRRTIVHQHRPYIEDLFAAERRQYRLQPDDATVEVLPFLGDHDYDDLLARNIAFLDLYDASANNVVVECLIRATPLLVNPLPAIVEYLGQEYPLYYTGRTQAARKAEDMSRIAAAHQYLAAHPLRDALSGEAFARSVAASPVFQRGAEAVV